MWGSASSGHCLTVARRPHEVFLKYSQTPRPHPTEVGAYQSASLHFVFVCPSDGHFGGLQTQMVRMAHWLVSHGHQVTVITISDETWGELLPESVRCIPLGARYWDFRYYFRARRLWQSLNVPRPDVIKTFNWELVTAWIGYQLAVITGAKALAGYYMPRQYLQRLEHDFYLRNFLRNMASGARIFMSPEQIEELEAKHGASGELWLLPVDLEHSLPAVRQPIWGRIVSIGRLSEMKEYNLYMIEVVAELIRRGYQVTWTVHGTGSYESQMRQMIRERNLDGIVVLAGAMPYEKCRQALADAYAFVGMGTSIIEASMFAVPNVLALAFDRKGLTYGPIYSVPLGSVGDTRDAPPVSTVADEIERLLKLDQEDYAAEAERVRTHVQSYETNRSMQRLMEIVEAAPMPHRRFWPCVECYLVAAGRRLRRISRCLT